MTKYVILSFVFPIFLHGFVDCNETNISKEFTNGLRAFVKSDPKANGQYLPYLAKNDSKVFLNFNRNKRFTTSYQPGKALFLFDFIRDDMFDGVLILTHGETLTGQRPMLVFLEKLFFNRGLTCDTILYNAPGDLKIHNAAQKIAIIALLPINVLKIVVQEAKSLNLLRSHITWLAEAKNASKNLGDSSLPINSQFNTFQSAGNEDSFVVKELYKITNNSQIQSNSIGVWNRNTGLLKTKTQFWQRRQNLNGLSFRVSVQHDAPYIYWKDPTKGPNPTHLYGYLVEVMEELAAMSNFKIEYSPSIDGLWGAEIGNGSFNGIIGMLQRKEVDLGLSAFIMSNNRKLAVDYLDPLDRLIFALFYKRNGIRDGSMTYVAPFEANTWVCTLLTCILSTIVYYFTGNYGSSGDEDYDFDWGLSATIIVHGIFMQGAPYEPKRLAPRMVFQIIFLAGFVIFSAYSACLTSFLALPKEREPFSDPLSLLNETNYRIATLPGSYLEDAYRTGTEVEQTLYRTRFEYLPDLETGVERLKNEPELALYWPKYSVLAVTGGSCEFKASPSFEIGGDYSILVQKGSPYRGLLNHQLRKMKENGSMQKLVRKWLPADTSEQCSNYKSEPLGLDMTFTTFVFLIVIGVICAIIGLVESCYKESRGVLHYLITNEVLQRTQRSTNVVTANMYGNSDN